MAEWKEFKAQPISQLTNINKNKDNIFYHMNSNKKTQCKEVPWNDKQVKQFVKSFRSFKLGQ